MEENGESIKRLGNPNLLCNHMKKILLLATLFILVGCSNSGYKKIDKANTLKLMKEKDAILIDVRSIAEYKSNHIENAVSYPITTILDDIKKIDKDTYIIVYCQSGSRSKIAAESLIEIGYKHIYDLGSIDNWN